MTQNGKPEVETDFDEIKREAADEEQGEQGTRAGDASDTSLPGMDYRTQEWGPAASAEDYDPFDVDPEDVDDK